MSKVVARSYFDTVGNSTVGLECEDPSRTTQASAEDADINVIINRYLKTGLLPQVAQGVYADISELTDLKEAFAQAQFAQEQFMELPADVRRFFNNDPVQLVEFASNPSNLPKAVELGLALPRPSGASPSLAGGQPAQPVQPGASAPKPPANAGG